MRRKEYAERDLSIFEGSKKSDKYKKQHIISWRWWIFWRPAICMPISTGLCSILIHHQSARFAAKADNREAFQSERRVENNRKNSLSFGCSLNIFTSYLLKASSIFTLLASRQEKGSFGSASKYEQTWRTYQHPKDLHVCKAGQVSVRLN